MSIKRISLALATAALAAGVVTAVGLPAQASPTAVAPVARTTAATTAKPIPAQPLDTLGFAKDGLEFGYITKATLKNGKVRIRVEQAEFYGGKAAKLLNGGIAPLDDHVTVVDKSLTPFTYSVSATASLAGVYDLVSRKTDDNHRQKLTARQLVSNFAALDDSPRVPVWIRHSQANDFSGPVTALAEQFIP